jgi:cytochrome c5
MKTTYKILVIAMVFLAIGVTVVACSSTKKTVNDETTTAVTEVEEEFKLEKSGAQYWGETCNRCHLAPSPADYNDTDWETISLHMRVRANLTENEITKIEEFLKSAN